jgi:O-antigen ligase
VDWALLGILVAILLQVLPLPAPIADVLSPHAAGVRENLALIRSGSAWSSLSIDRASTLWAGAVMIGAIALFFAARTIVTERGLRQTVRGVSGIGLAFSAVALAQEATAGRSIYWRFPTEYEGPLPFGPFVNRNHFATWAIMAAPLCFGYMMARSARADGSESSFVGRRARLTRMADGRMIWLAAAGTMMLIALLASSSRSGIVALMAASGVFAFARHRNGAVPRAWWVIVLVVLIVGFALSRADISGLTERFTQSPTGIRDRATIWRDTLPIVRDFWLSGTGVGTYRTAMLVYQRADRQVQFNQAHNHYLQVATEGGILLFGLMGVALVAFWRATWKELAAESSGAYWIRAGAACGLVAVALQSLWETGLVMPANAGLAAVLAAIASHER